MQKVHLLRSEGNSVLSVGWKHLVAAFQEAWRFLWNVVLVRLINWCSSMFFYPSNTQLSCFELNKNDLKEKKKSGFLICLPGTMSNNQNLILLLMCAVFMTLRLIHTQKDCINTWVIFYRWFKRGSMFPGRLSPCACLFPVIAGIKLGVCFSLHWRAYSLESSNCISLRSFLQYNLSLQSKHTSAKLHRYLCPLCGFQSFLRKHVQYPENPTSLMQAKS